MPIEQSNREHDEDPIGQDAKGESTMQHSVDVRAYSEVIRTMEPPTSVMLRSNSHEESHCGVSLDTPLSAQDLERLIRVIRQP
ncbi:MAG: hypothetical protein HQL50_02035 [Magnetococcales bacterium]|nr:hypothetical protein [Magnetococcales bacterium]